MQDGLSHGSRGLVSGRTTVHCGNYLETRQSSDINRVAGPGLLAPLDPVVGKSIIGAVEARAGSEPSIALIDDRTLVRECVASWLKLTLNASHIATFATAAACRRATWTDQSIALIVYSIGNRRTLDAGVDRSLSLLFSSFPDTPVILISEVDDAQAIVQALKRGVRGYIPTTLGLKIAVGAVRLVREGGVFVPASVVISGTSSLHVPAPQQPALRDDLGQVLTPRQVTVLGCLRRGMANKTIAFELNMSQSTVKVHIRNIMKKVRATNRTQVVFLTSGLVGR